jgi:anti-sigma regulatory factor (Ser/Thr protein kinase)
VTAISDPPETGRPFRHEALFYADPDEFVAGTSSFIRDGLARDEAVLVVVDVAKIDRLRRTLGADADTVEFADMADVGRNPALIIQAWRDFADGRAQGQVVRGIGEPISPDRSEAALEECHIHESLLNVAFERDTDFWLLCPYDTVALPAPVLDRAVANHPFVCDRHGARADERGPWPKPREPCDGDARTSALAPLGAGFDWALAPAPAPVETLAFDRATLHALRAFVLTAATRGGVDETRARELTVAACEIATNSIVHGGASGDVRVWVGGDFFVTEIRGAGRVVDPLAGRLRPEPARGSGYGLWLANQFCDLVQIRSTASVTAPGSTTGPGTIVRLHVRAR